MSPEVSVAELYWGTRTTWNRRTPCVLLLAAAFRYAFRRPPPPPVPTIVRVPPASETARTYS